MVVRFSIIELPKGNALKLFIKAFIADHSGPLLYYSPVISQMMSISQTARINHKNKILTLHDNHLISHKGIWAAFEPGSLSIIGPLRFYSIDVDIFF